MKRWINEFVQTVRTTVFTNPVVMRDLRAQMRGTRSYWYMGGYLLLLGVLSIAGYAVATQQGMGAYAGAGGTVNIVDAQSDLSVLYYFIFGTIAAFIILIAPALTAASIVGERQRLSFDLLVTTPLRASEMLIGKLVSSIAFLGLLLVLSLPAAALCILLGGATLLDVLRIYVQLAIDGAVLAAIGLYFSCASKTTLLAVVWSYVSVALFCFLTVMVSILDGAMRPMNGFPGLTHPSALLAIGALNPVMVITPGVHTSVALFGLTVPTLLASAVFALLGIRLLVTAATYRLGVFGIESAISVRRQILPLLGLLVYLLGSCRTAGFFSVSNTTPFLGVAIFWMIVGGFCVSAVFLPSLFVPTPANEDMAGGLHRHTAADGAAYRMRRAFLPVHSGALPYYHLLLLVVAVAALLSFPQNFVQSTHTYTAQDATQIGIDPLTVASYTLGGLAYAGALGYLVWTICRFTGAVVKNVAGARAMAFGIFALIVAVPIMIIALSRVTRWEDHLAAMTSIIYPFINQPYPGNDAFVETFRNSVASSTGISLCYGFLFAGLGRLVTRRASRVAVLPGGATTV